MRDGDLKTELKVLKIYNTFISNMQVFFILFHNTFAFTINTNHLFFAR